MYSHEIEEYIKLRNYLLSAKEIIEVISIDNNPQINKIHYDSYNDQYEINTSDNYDFKFKVKRLT